MSDSNTAGTLDGAGGGGGDPQPPQPNGAEEDINDNRPMTSEEKHQLSLGINMLPGPELSRVIQIIEMVQPSPPEGDPNEFEIDFEKLEPLTLRALERFIKSKVPYVYEQVDEDD